MNVFFFVVVLMMCLLFLCVCVCTIIVGVLLFFVDRNCKIVHNVVVGDVLVGCF